MGRLRNFFHSESAGGVLIIIATVLALFCQNTFLSGFYNDFLRTEAGFVLNEHSVIKPIILWVNDGLMALFFFNIGLEVKKEIMVGELSSARKVALPVIGGAGGVIVPALVFLLFTHQDPFWARGWAIPTVSDTAFAVGVLLLLGSRIPVALKLFLLLLAIIDDICAVVAIAIFYTSELSNAALQLAGIATLILALLNLLKVNKTIWYLMAGIFLWLAFLESGVHSTIAGIVASIFIPLKPINGYSMLEDVMESLHGFITFFVMPIFAFVNAGVALTGDAFANLLHPVSLGILTGLLIAKPIGIFSFSYVAIKLKLCSLPRATSYIQFFGLCVLTGIGASMSLFIASIAYADSDEFHYAEKIAILLASFIAAIVGWFILYKNSKKPDLEDHLGISTSSKE
ncbi:MAG: Na+/H+ antiporter NhaA [Campylobacter sp.]|nr:Na+/H+ antiporter NhaA [Campylobacter sp.]